MGTNAMLVKKLRGITSAGIMNCKQALIHTDGNIELAVDWLRKNGLSSVRKKSGRVTTEGIIALYIENNQAVILEINCETDFVSRNKKFHTFVNNVVKSGITIDGNIDLLKSKILDQTTIQDHINHMIATFGENISLRRISKLSINEGIISSYIHSRVSQNLGKIGVIVSLESKADPAFLEDLGKKIAMHIAASHPIAITINDLDKNLIQREKSILREQIRESQQPQEIIEKMIQGRLRKYYENVVLLEQKFIIDGTTKVQKIIENASIECGYSIVINDFIRFEVSEILN